ncbi:MAG: hypothetical protein ACTHJ8_11960 [Mucilaginibacter sp.]
MALKIYKPTLLLLVILSATVQPALAQDSTSVEVNNTVKTSLNLGMQHLSMAMNDLNKSLNLSLKDLNKSLNIYLDKGLKEDLKNLNENIVIDLNNDNVNVQNVNEKVKNYSKSYPMDANDRLSIDNKFGKVVINTWNKNEVRVEVQIKSYADNDATAQKMIDAINISDNKSGDQISFRTNFGEGSNHSIWDLFNTQNDHHKAEVNYMVYMPSRNNLEIDNRYGATQVPDFDGKVRIDCAYGSFEGGSLMHQDNAIHVRYGSARIQGLSSSDVSVSYGSLDLGSADKLNGELRYSSAHIGKLKNTANIDASYAGDIRIESLDRNFSSFSYNGRYSGLKIGVENATNANFDITVRYGDFNYGDVPIEITEKTPSDDSKGWKPTKNYKGHIGRGSSDKVINISTSFGGVKFE